MRSQLWPPARLCRTPGQALGASSPLCLKNSLCRLYRSPHVPLGLSWAAPLSQGPGLLQVTPPSPGGLGPWRAQLSLLFPPPANLNLGRTFGSHTSRQSDLGPGAPVPGQEEAGQALPWPVMGTRSPRGQPSPALGEGSPEQVDRCPQGCGRIHAREPRQGRSWAESPGSWALSEEQSFLSLAGEWGANVSGRKPSPWEPFAHIFLGVCPF